MVCCDDYYGAKDFIFMRKAFTLHLLILSLALCGSAAAQLPGADAAVLAGASGIELQASASTLTPEAALATYQRRMQDQAARLASYSDITLMEAQIPDSTQKGEYELRRSYTAPNRLEYTPVRFTGDGFVKNNVLLRYLQSEVEHVTKQQGDQTAISDQNYKFSLKSTEEMNGHRCYVFQVKPVKKRVGLFKGRVFIDADTGAIRRAEGSFVKSPSWWIKKIEFVQDFDEIGGFNLPVKLASISKVRVIGRTVVNVFHNNYQTVAATRSQQVVSLGGGAQ
jgi:hypothetical protein